MTVTQGVTCIGEHSVTVIFWRHLLAVPDGIVLNILKERLCQLDCQTRGWVLSGYPRTREQAEQLDKAGLAPNRSVSVVGGGRGGEEGERGKCCRVTKVVYISKQAQTEE